MASDRIKIAYILTPITFGGAEKVSLNFLRAVNRCRFDLRPILLTRPWEDEPYFAREIRQMGYAYDTLPVAVKTGGDPLRVPRVAQGVYSLLKRGGFDLVHTQGYFADICGLPVARLLGLPGISTCHGFIDNDRKLKTYNFLDKCSLRLCRSVIAVSEGIRDELVRSGLLASRIAVIPNAVAPPCGGGAALEALRQQRRGSLGLGANEPVVGYLGRLSEEKGLVHLIEAIAAMRSASTPVRLLLVGDGPQRAALERQVQTLGLDGLVVFAGFQTDAETWLPAFDIFALPSLTEGTPMALLEAMAAGVPVIASAVGGVPKVVTDGVNGLLVLPADVAALVGGLQTLSGNPELRGRLGSAGEETIRANYGIESWSRTIEGLYLGRRTALSGLAGAQL